jgi:hypothetical protein
MESSSNRNSGTDWKKKTMIPCIWTAILVINWPRVGWFVDSESAVETKAQYPAAAMDESDL